jgi:4-amino-4-deoxy-L-arabinose transferase-like glycosyltransferase
LSNSPNVFGRLAPLLFAASIAVVYLWRLSSAPIYLAHDEAIYAVQEHAIATTLRDTSGTLLPLYLHTIYWTAPLHIYLGALILRFAHPSETVIRLPCVIAGLAAIWSMYFAGARLFRSRWYGLLAAMLLALTPALFLASRFKVESHFPVPFVVGWMLCLLLYEDTRRTSWLAAAGATLGLGIYTYHASPVMMPVYAALTLWLLWMRGEWTRAHVLALVAGFCVVAAPYVIFALSHPEYLRHEVTSYQVFNSTRVAAVEAAAPFTPWVALKTRILAYYEYFNPSFLFFSGGASIEDTTQKAGVLILPLALLLPAGVYRIVRHEPRTALLYLAGLLIGPLAAIIVGEGDQARRILFMLPFAAIVATYGVRQWLTAKTRWLHAAGIATVALVPVFFGAFYADYLGDYRTRSAVWFEANIRDALESAISASGHSIEPTPVFISTGMNGYIRWYWRFYLLKHNRAELEARTTFFNARGTGPVAFPDRSIVVAEADARERLETSDRSLSEIARAREPNGAVSFYVWTKQP